MFYKLPFFFHLSHLYSYLLSVNLIISMGSLQSEFSNLNNEFHQFKTRTYHQYYATFCMCFLAFAYGSNCGWNSNAIIQLTDEENSPLNSVAIDTDDVGWIASGIGIGGFIGNLFFGWVCHELFDKNLFKMNKSYQKKWVGRTHSTS